MSHILNKKVFRKDELLNRYSMFASQVGQPMSERTLDKWRKDKGFPEPVVSRPRAIFLVSKVLEWEKEQGWSDFFE
ncbi:hypothetical protein [Vibrio cyclitrophicus]|uniref:hypothetical protein n=1 Tax=Vibrio cyclitrophicus TaxID=47951 RepID=UPI0003800AEA|nr:hypothetical protein [Vibrio cyclitrophicus]OEE43751.1 hypothetical protein OAG_20135 [Vibrio cyclitrophicus FF75]